MDTPDERLKRAIASVRTDVVEVEVLKFSHPLTNTIWMSSFVEDGTTIVTPNDGNQVVRYIPLATSEHRQGGRMTAGRTISVEGLNHLIRLEEDKIPPFHSTPATVEFYTYLMEKNATLSTVVQGPLKFYVQKIIYSAKKNAANINVTTSPTNTDETGIAINKLQFPGIEAFQ